MEFEFEDEPKSDDRRDQMDQEQSKTTNLVDTTDCLEAVGVIRCWKNFLFIIILLVMLFLQTSFLLMTLKHGKDAQPADTAELSSLTAGADEPATKVTDKVKQAADTSAAQNTAEIAPSQLQIPAEPNWPALTDSKPPFLPKVKHIAAVVRFLNFLLIPSAALYCLTMLFSLKISLIGRLGGINHIARAFFLSLLFIVLLLPWQLMFSPVFLGAMFTPAELINACQAVKTPLAYVSFYLRFTGYWLLVLLLLLFAQIRSIRWARATLMRLEVI
jgi:hypothetical protein